MAPIYACLHESARISAADFARIVEANHLQQVQDFCPAWNLMPTAVVVATPESLPLFVPSAIACHLRDSRPDDPKDALAYHTVENGLPVVHVLVDVILSSPYAGVDDISCALGHEVCETNGDMPANEWSERWDGMEEPHEAVDRVQGGSYEKIVKLSDGNTTRVRVTNFLTPNAFNDDPPPRATFDWLGVLKHPRDIAVGGYTIVRPVGGGESMIFGDKKAARAYSHSALRKHGVPLDDTDKTPIP